jgi:plastocyanin
MANGISAWLVACSFAAAIGACASSSSGGADAGPPLVNGCAVADFAASDHTAASDPRAIGFPQGIAPGPYTPSCMTVRVGQSVTWTGDFTAHPLESFGGDAMSPITPMTMGTMASVTFATPGVFGFHCANHPSTMLGAIKVIN